MRRKTDLPNTTPVALTSAFAENVEKIRLWNAFIRKTRIGADGLTLTDIKDNLVVFLMPPTLALVNGQSFEQKWIPGGPWETINIEYT